MTIGRRILVASLIIDMASLALFFALAAFDFSADRIVPAFALRWELSSALLEFFRWLPALQFLGVAIAFGSGSGASEGLVKGSFVTVIALSSLLAAASAVGLPILQEGLSSMRIASSAFKAALESTRAALESGDLSLATRGLGALKAIEPRDGRVVELSGRLEAAIAKAGRGADTKPADGAAGRAGVEGGAGAARDFYLKALAYSEKKDFFNAHSYALAAARLDPSYTDAKRLAARAWEEIVARGSDTSDRERAVFYARKLEGYGLLRAGDAVGAYQIFRELEPGHEADPDVHRYLGESLAALEKVAFFRDEADRALAGTVLRRFFLALPSGEGEARLLAAAEAAWQGDALYLREFEYLEIAGSSPRARLSTPNAKLAGGKLFLVSVDRERPAEVARPTWRVKPRSVPASVLDIGLSAEIAYRVSAARLSPNSLSAVEIWKAAGEAPNYGIDPAPLVGELLERSRAPFALFTASALGIFAGLRFRRRDEMPLPKGLYALVPFMALALAPILTIADKADSLVSAWAFRILPGLGSLGIASALRALGLLLVLLLIAGAREDRDAADRT
jgi:tetratricopeptide (TPR) repeat protein